MVAGWAGRVKEKFRIQKMSDIAIPVLLFFTALIPRLIYLGGYITYDETLWLRRSLKFFTAVTSHNWVGTFQTPHPGVTTMWLSGIPLGIINRLTDLGWIQVAFNEYLFAASFPIVLTVCAGIVAMYFLMRKSFDGRISLVAAFLIALDPYFLGLSRLTHLDALLTTFMALSALALLAYLNRPDKRMLAASGVFMGLALLTKTPALFLVPFSLLAAFLWYVPGHAHDLKTLKASLIAMARCLIPIAAIAAVIFIVLWPSMWINFVFTINAMIQYADTMVANSHSSMYFLGQVLKRGDYDVLFYPIVILMKMTPVTMLFSFICILGFAAAIARKKFSKNERTLLIIFSFVFFFTLQMALGKKEMVRYILPIFPFIDIMAAAGIFYVSKVASGIVDRAGSVKQVGRYILPAIAIVSIVATLALVIQVCPYYLSYSNPALRFEGLQPDKMILMGSGDGMDLAAKYLNEKPGAQDLVVAAQYNGFQPYFEGKTVSMKNASRADYVVFYLCTVQRKQNEKLFESYQDLPPEKVITINGMDYCWIYPVRNASA